MSNRSSRKRDSLYRDDLAQVHVDGYGFHWEGAAPAILAWLREFGIHDGLVVDLGCGGGQWLARLASKGYQTCGVDVSASMIAIAQRTSPSSEFLCDSFAEADLPACDGVTSLGEPLNYLNSGPLMRRTIRKVSAALRPGGVLIFDVRHPPLGPQPPVNYVRSGPDWFCHSRIEEDQHSLTRHITTFRRVDGKHYRREEETHRLKLFARSEMVAWLRDAGFRVRTRRGYGDYRLGPRRSVFLCRKPT